MCDPGRELETSESCQRKDRMFGPLKFADAPKKNFPFDFVSDEAVACVLCDVTFILPTNKTDFLTHLFAEHKLVIADVDNIACLKAYINYWRVRFSSEPLNYFCTTMWCDTTGEEGTSREEHFLLSDVLPEDRSIRDGLQQRRLEWVLQQQKQERETPVSLSCFFCRRHFEGPRREYFNHLYEKHNVHLGSPDNLVFTDDLLSIIGRKIERLECIFCEGVFKDRHAFKEHMRKKQHKRVNPFNKAYDRFYVVNYLEIGKSWQQVLEEADDFDQMDELSDWSDWQDVDECEFSIVCLYCEEARGTFDYVMTHMQSAHGFDYLESCQAMGLHFYQQVKLVNYIRLKMYKLECTNCDAVFSSREVLLNHMAENEHFRIPSVKLWDQPEFYFPTYENDNFLCQLDDLKDGADDHLSTMLEECRIEEEHERLQASSLCARSDVPFS